MRDPNVVYRKLGIYTPEVYAKCGYVHISNKDVLYRTLEEALAVPPASKHDSIEQLFNEEQNFYCASTNSEGDGWILDENCDSRKVAEFELDLEKFDRIPSLNAEYTVKGGRYPQKTLTTFGRKFKDWLKKVSIDGDNELLGLVKFWDSVNWRAQKTGDFRYYLQVDFIFYIKPNHTFHRRDTSNMIKLPEDALSDIWGINDARHVRLGLCEKRETPRGSEGNEILQIRVQLLQTKR